MSTTTDQPPTEETNREPVGAEAGTGVDGNLAGTRRVLGWLTGRVLYSVESERVRFHVVQSTAIFGGLTGLSVVLGAAQTITTGFDDNNDSTVSTTTDQ
jgi:hypothetical protein